MKQVLMTGIGTAAVIWHKWREGRDDVAVKMGTFNNCGGISALLMTALVSVCWAAVVVGPQ